MFRKADRLRIEALSAWANQFTGWPETLSVQVKATASVLSEEMQQLRDGQDKLLQSHAALKADLDGLAQVVGAIAARLEGRIDQRWADSQRRLAALAEQVDGINVHVSERLSWIAERLGPDFSGITKESLDVLRDSLPMRQHFSKPRVKPNGKRR